MLLEMSDGGSVLSSTSDFKSSVVEIFSSSGVILFWLVLLEVETEFEEED